MTVAEALKSLGVTGHSYGKHDLTQVIDESIWYVDGFRKVRGDEFGVYAYRSYKFHIPVEVFTGYDTVSSFIVLKRHENQDLGLEV